MSSFDEPRILVVHNRYKYRGGEDSVVDSEISMLQSRGHEVATYTRDNADIERMPAWSVAIQTTWSQQSGAEIGRLIREFRPDVIHCHNLFPLISPSLYWTARAAGIPVVQTLHNFRLLCLNAMFLRDGRICEDCLGAVPWRGVLRSCYRDSVAASAVAMASLAVHRSIGTYESMVSRYIALNEFGRRKFIEAGFAAERVCVKPNFVDLAAPSSSFRQGLLFVGRLSEEKGVRVLAEALHALPFGTVRVAGTGPAAGLLQSAAGTRMLGVMGSAEVAAEMASAVALVVPSVWYEGFPRTLVEAFACGLPVIASRIGALAEIVTDGVHGLLFAPGDARDLAAKALWALAHPEEMERMGRAARLKYEQSFTATTNYRILRGIYDEVLAERATHA